MNPQRDVAEIEFLLGQLRDAPGDEDAWRALFRMTWPFVITLCRRSLSSLGRVSDAEDVAQEVFLKFAVYWRERCPAINDESGLFSLLAVMTRQLSRDSARRLGRAKRDMRRERSFSDDGEGSPAEQQAADVEIRDLLDRVCEMLDAQDRHIIQLRLQGYEQAEVAQRLGMSLRTIERRLQRIRSVLGPYLEPDTNTPA